MNKKEEVAKGKLKNANFQKYSGPIPNGLNSSQKL
jgi:hypothetical protein